MVAGLLVVSVALAPTEASAGVDPRVPGPSNPVGPTNWSNMTTHQEFVDYNSGGSVTVSNVRFLEGFDITNGTHVTMRNCHVISPGSFWTVFVRDGSLLMEDCQVGDDTTAAGGRGVGGNNVTLRRVKVVGHTDGIKTGDNSLYEQVWVTDLRDRGEGHLDGVQDDGGGGGWTIRYSRLEGINASGVLGNAAAMIGSALGPIDDVTLEGNVLDGGNYVVMVTWGCNTTCHPDPTNVVIRNNAFGRNFRYGVLLYRENSDITWEGNFWEDNGKYIDRDGHLIGGGTTPSPSPPPSSSGPFTDVPSSHTFASDIAWLAKAGITRGCNPPLNTRFCPSDYVTRGQMAAFLVRALGLSAGGGVDRFSDDDGSVFENDIDRIATAGITRGCNPPLNTRFCPSDYVTRGQMAAFLQRAFAK
jgi:hypothetical protein